MTKPMQLFLLRTTRDRRRVCMVAASGFNSWVMALPNCGAPEAQPPLPDGSRPLGSSEQRPLLQSPTAQQIGSCNLSVGAHLSRGPALPNGSLPLAAALDAAHPVAACKTNMHEQWWVGSAEHIVWTADRSWCRGAGSRPNGSRRATAQKRSPHCSPQPTSPPPPRPRLTKAPDKAEHAAADAGAQPRNGAGGLKGARLGDFARRLGRCAVHFQAQHRGLLALLARRLPFLAAAAAACGLAAALLGHAARRAAVEEVGEGAEGRLMMPNGRRGRQRRPRLQSGPSAAVVLYGARNIIPACSQRPRCSPGVKLLGLQANSAPGRLSACPWLPMQRLCSRKLRAPCHGQCWLHGTGVCLSVCAPRPCLRLHAVAASTMPPSLPIAIEAWAKEPLDARLSKSAASGGDCLPPAAVQAALQLHEQAITRVGQAKGHPQAARRQKQRWRQGPPSSRLCWL